MQQIEIEGLFVWLQHHYDQKYCQQLEQLKKTFLTFYNLTQQIISIYNYIMEQTLTMASTYPNSVDDLKHKSLASLKLIIERTIIILHKLVENQKLCQNKVGAIDLSYCQKFIRNFSQNLNILCTYYHSLNHCEIVEDSFKYEKKKIVEGINKLYTIHNVIKQLYFQNETHLASIENHKIYAFINIRHILMLRDELANQAKIIYPPIENNLSDFYQHFCEHFRCGKNGSMTDLENNSMDSADQTIKKLMKNYFRIVHQFSEAQAEFQYYLRPVQSYCEQLKNKKKQQLNFSIADSINTFSRITSQLLKTNFSFKNYKKVRVEDLSKALTLILEDMMLNWSGANATNDFKENIEFFGHKVCKQLGIGLLGKTHLKDSIDFTKVMQKQKQKQAEEKAQKQRTKQKQKQKQPQKTKQKPPIQKQPQKSNNPKSKTQTQSKNKSKNKIQQLQKLKQPQKSYQDDDEYDDEDDRDNQPFFQNKQSIQRKRPMHHNYDGNQGTPQQRVAEVVQEVCDCAYFVLDCMRELEKVQNAGLMNMIQEYKENLGVCSGLSTGTVTNISTQQYEGMSKVINNLCEYQRYINAYFRLHENTKQFQKIMRQIILQQFKIKVNININMNINKTMESGLSNESRNILKKSSRGEEDSKIVKAE